MKNKLTSRKFLMALSGVITGIFLIISGDATEGATAIISSIVSYCVAEGYVDAHKLTFSLDDKRE